MTGWSILIWGGTCAVGAFFLLSLVSHEIGRIELVMDSFARTEARAAKRRKKRRAKEVARRALEEASGGGDASEDEPPVVLEAVKG